MSASVRRLLAPLALLLALAAGPAWLLAYAVTPTGRAIAAGGLLAAALPLTLHGAVRRGARWRTWAGVSLLLLLAIAGVWLAILRAAPPGAPRPGSPVGQRWSGRGSFHRYALSNVVPEAEQVNLGFAVMPWLDPIMTRAQARRVSRFTLDIYRQMDQDEDFRRLGSAMGLAYREVLGRPVDDGHAYLYLPRGAGEEPLPLLVFFHGAFGNFKAYTWVWSHLAEEQGVAILAPSFGFGSWREPLGTAVARRAIREALANASLDPQRVYLAGLSNGGLVVSRLAAQSPGQFRGLVLISPVMDTAVVDSPAFHQAWAGRPVLVLTGAQDERVPVGYVQEHAARLRTGRVRVTEIVYPGEDHFLLFSQRARVLQDVASWLQGTADP